MDPPRQPHDLQGLLKLAIQSKGDNDSSSPPDLSVLSEERRKWLEEALKGLSVDIIEELSKALKILNPDRVTNPDEDSERMEEALERLIDFVDSIDTANGKFWLIFAYICYRIF